MIVLRIILVGMAVPFAIVGYDVGRVLWLMNWPAESLIASFACGFVAALCLWWAAPHPASRFWRALP